MRKRTHDIYTIRLPASTIQKQGRLSDIMIQKLLAIIGTQVAVSHSSSPSPSPSPSTIPYQNHYYNNNEYLESLLEVIAN